MREYLTLTRLLRRVHRHRSPHADHQPRCADRARSSTARSSTTRCSSLMRRIMSGEMSPVMIAALTDRPARQEGDDRRDHRRGAGDARVRDQGRGRRPRRTWSTSSAPAATARTPSTSRPASMFVAAAAGARVSQARQPQRLAQVRQRRRARGARAPTSTLTPAAGRRMHRRDRHRLHVRAEPPSGDEARRRRCARSSACARSSTSSGRSPIRPARRTS